MYLASVDVDRITAQVTSSHPWPNCSPLTPTYPHLPPLTHTRLVTTDTAANGSRPHSTSEAQVPAQCPVCGHRTFHRPVFYILSFTLLACIMLQDVLGNPSKEKKWGNWGGGLLSSTIFFTVCNLDQCIICIVPRVVLCSTQVSVENWKSNFLQQEDWMECNSIWFRKGYSLLNSKTTDTDTRYIIICRTEDELQLHYLHLILIHIFSGTHLFVWDCKFLIVSDCKAAKIKSSEMH